MNFLDSYEVSGTSTPPTSNQPEQSLNEELSQVIGQLGRFWGGFRKQSQNVLESARGGFGDVVTQAQRELGKLTNESPNVFTQDEGITSEKESDTQAGSSSETESTMTSSTATLQPTPSLSSQTLFSRLQSALPPNVVSTVQNNIPESLKHASGNFDFAQLRTTLSSEFQRVQGVTRAQAEEYVHKSEALLRDAMKEAGEVLKDAVKVVPPEEVDSARAASGVFWDGTDMWTLPSPTGEDWTDVKGKGRDLGSPSQRSSGEARRAVATRAEALLKRLKHDPEIIKLDPYVDDAVKESYADWLKAEVNAKEDGIDNEEWKRKIEIALSQSDDGEALKATLDVLVPSELIVDVFWTRYFFRVHQIESEETKRKALLQGSVENEEDFSWEDDEDEATSPKPAVLSNRAPLAARSPVHTPAVTSTNPEKPSSPPSRPHTPTFASPRDSSEDSYDLVSSGNVSATGDGHTGTGDKKPNADDPDSDWE